MATPCTMACTSGCVPHCAPALRAKVLSLQCAIWSTMVGRRGRRASCQFGCNVLQRPIADYAVCAALPLAAICTDKRLSAADVQEQSTTDRTLSVSICKMGSSSSTLSLAALSTVAMEPSVMLSPMLGTVTSVASAAPATCSHLHAPQAFATAGQAARDACAASCDKACCMMLRCVDRQ